jgi:hypothetical protein
VVVSFFWQPVASAMAATAAKPRIRNFFINLFSLLICETLCCPGEREAKDAVS